MARAWLAVLVALSAGSAAGAQPVQEPALPQAAPEASEQSVGPTAGAPTIDLAAAIRLALGQAFTLLDSQDAVAASRWRERTAFADFLPAVTPIYQRGEGRNVFGADLSQKLPWTGGSVTASGRYLNEPNVDAPFPRTTDLRLLT